MLKDILVPRIDVELLRRQRAELERLVANNRTTTNRTTSMDGLLFMLDYMIDKAEGVIK